MLTPSRPVRTVASPPYSKGARGTEIRTPRRRTKPADAYDREQDDEKRRTLELLAAEEPGARGVPQAGLRELELNFQRTLSEARIFVGATSDAPADAPRDAGAARPSAADCAGPGLEPEQLRKLVQALDGRVRCAEADLAAARADAAVRIEALAALLARAAGRGAAVLEWHDGVQRAATQQRSSLEDEIETLARQLAAKRIGSNSTLADEDDVEDGKSQGSDEDDFGWVPPSAHAPSAWNIVRDGSLNDDVGKAVRRPNRDRQVRRLQKELEAERGSHAALQRSLQTRLSRSEASVARLQSYTNDKELQLKRSNRDLRRKLAAALGTEAGDDANAKLVPDSSDDDTFDWQPPSARKAEPRD
ncbi:hypothetical protein M885DRAFT_504381 [Pelagophyceae sp. CCMP2097]|nr:hypothetical protein M885DRAFT_504381 [Pelagophyceae sp. CCMP2097]